MHLVHYQVLLPNKFWELAKRKEELKLMINQYFSDGYPHYDIQQIIKIGTSHIAICIRR
ncbi:Phage protein [Bacillus mycoides]|nr:Phage protein [Bacillus mycoides]